MHGNTIQFSSDRSFCSRCSRGISVLRPEKIEGARAAVTFVFLYVSYYQF